MCPLYVTAECPYVFGTEDRDKVEQLSRKLQRVARDFDVSIPPATSVTKAIATKGGELGDADRVALAHSISHSPVTADRYYRACGESKSVQGYEVVGSILTIPKVKKRHSFSAEQ